MPVNQAKTVSTPVPANFVLTTPASIDVLKPISQRPMDLSLLLNAEMLANQVLIAQVPEHASSVSMAHANTDAQMMKFSTQSRQLNAVMLATLAQTARMLEPASCASITLASTDALSSMESQSSFLRLMVLLSAVTHAMMQLIAPTQELADSALKEPANTDADNPNQESII